jgi:3-oxoacyl-[acyl-carrier-protein] synthase III
MRTAGRIVIDAAATFLPGPGWEVRDALEQRRLTTRDATSSGYRSLPVATAAAPDLAVAAAERALTAAGREAADVSLLAHAWIYHQGHDFWSPAHYIAHRLGALGAVPVGVQQMCNGGAAALEVAVGKLLSDPLVTTALVTSADRFAEPGFDRWQADYGILYGDGAAAAVLSRGGPDGDALRLLAIHTSAAPQLEVMHRGDRPFSPAAREHGASIDVRATKKHFLSTVAKEDFAATVSDAVTAVLGKALADAEVPPDDPRLRWVLLPRLGSAARETIYAPAISRLTAAPCLDLGAETGHLGAGDVLANMAALTALNLLRPGEIALLLSAGAGFTWTALVVGAPGDHAANRGPHARDTREVVR